MQIDTIDRTGLGRLEAARDSMNAAYNALALDRQTDPLTRDVALARGYMCEARDAVAPLGGSDGLDDATFAARGVLPRLEHALQLLDAMGVAPDPLHVAPLLDELGFAMDHVEQALAGAGWE